MSNYLLSVIIPTKNRQEYCISAVQQIVNLNDSQIQIVIQDNSSQALSLSYPWILNVKNIKYHYNSSTISFVDNFSEAVSLADGKYLCMIGDDDGILPNITKIARFAENQKVEAVIPALNSVYLWPTPHPIVKKGEQGYLCISYLNAQKTWVNTEKGLLNLLKNGGQNYQSFDIPRLYHGLVRKDVVERVKEKTGYYFGGLTPDMYMAVSLSIVCDRVVKLGFPITVSGICPGSGSANSATGKHTGNLEDAPHFIGHDSYQWSNNVPAIYTVETIWADTMLHALSDFNSDYIKEFDEAALIAICSHKYPQFKDKYVEEVNKNHIGKMSIVLRKKDLVVKPQLSRLFRRITRKQNDVMKYYNIQNIQAAVSKTERQLMKYHID